MDLVKEATLESSTPPGAIVIVNVLPTASSVKSTSHSRASKTLKYSSPTVVSPSFALIVKSCSHWLALTG